MSINRVVALMVIAGLSFSSAAFAAETEQTDQQEKPPAMAQLTDVIRRTSVIAPTPVVVPQVKRPALLPALYLSLGAMQAWDVYSTSAALKAGAYEANPTARFTGGTGSMIALNAVTTASTIFFAERMWKKNKVGAVVLMTAINGATAAVSMHNMRNARIASGRIR